MPKLKRPLIMTGISKFSPKIKMSFSIPKRENRIQYIFFVFETSFADNFRYNFVDNVRYTCGYNFRDNFRYSLGMISWNFKLKFYEHFGGHF